MQFSRKLLISGYRYPALPTAPTSYTTQILANVNGANYTVFTVPEDGWYWVEVQGGGGGGAYDNPAASSGGRASKLVYLYKDMKCLMWSGQGPQDKGHCGACGYPGFQDNTFGGYGAVGPTTETMESGASGGGGCRTGHNGYTGSWTGGGGAGSGFVAGFTDLVLPEQSVTLGSMTLSINRNFSIENVVSMSSVATYLIGAGGGGAASDNGTYRASGGGGGAFGNGGTTYRASIAAQSGPAGAWGKGEDGSRYGGGTRGAWAVVDFSTDTFEWGLGGGPVGSNGFCEISKVIPN